jgi:hypothetical protein
VITAWQGLEQQVSQLEASLNEERSAHNAVALQLTSTQHALECLQDEHKTLQGAHMASSRAMPPAHAQHTRFVYVHCKA